MVSFIILLSAFLLAGKATAAIDDTGPSPRADAPAPAAAPGNATTPRIAITIDDLPWVGPAVPDKPGATDRLLKTLRDHGAVATGFVNCGRMKPEEPVVQRWLAAGMDLGNHSSDHRDLDHAETSLWLDDVSRCDAALRTLTGRPMRYFRYPFLHQGATIEKRDAATALLSKLGLAVAHVSVDNSDWRLARWYGEAVEKKGETRREQIAAAYLDHMTEAVRHFQEVARAKVGRDVSHILLLHANQLAADHLGDVLESLRGSGFVFVTLEEALKDPVYSKEDAYLGPWGCSWLDRIAPPDLEQKWIDDQDRALQDRFEPRGSR